MGAKNPMFEHVFETTRHQVAGMTIRLAYQLPMSIQWRHRVVSGLISALYRSSKPLHRPATAAAYPMFQSADDAIASLLNEHQWQVMSPGESEQAVSEVPPLKKSTYELYEDYMQAQLNEANRPARAKLYRFLEDGECIAVPGGPMNAVAFELNRLLQLEIEEPGNGSKPAIETQASAATRELSTVDPLASASATTAAAGLNPLQAASLEPECG